MTGRLSERTRARFIARVAAAHSAASPVAAPARRRVSHVVYGGAHLFREDTITKVARLARASFETYAESASVLAAALGIPPAVADVVFEKVSAKLATNAVEDYRIDFEDGYGVRGDDEEDEHAISAARGVVAARLKDALPSAIGLRVKSLSPSTYARAVRTLDNFLFALARESVAAGLSPLPADFVITLPKVTSPVEVAAFVELLGGVESELGLPPGALSVELMIETPEALFGGDGALAIPALVRAGGGRVSALHLGSYDLTASMGVAANEQRLNHPLCDFAKALMKSGVSVLGAGSRISLSDGATTTLPVPPHRGPALSAVQLLDNTAAVHAAWRQHADNVRHGLRDGFFQGWDLHPAQIPARFSALYAFFAEALPAMTQRLRAFRDEAERATRVGQTFDDKATAEGLENFFAQGRACGALTREDSLW